MYNRSISKEVVDQLIQLLEVKSKGENRVVQIPKKKINKRKIAVYSRTINQ